MPSDRATDRYDAIVVGAGPCGLATAIALRKRGLTVAVIERAAGPRARIGETVPGELREPLHALGAWPAFRAAGHMLSSGGASAWSTSELRYADGFCDPSGGGWHVDRHAFETLLADQALGAGAVLHWSTKAVGIDATSGPVPRLHTVAPTGRSLILHSRVLLDATGRDATVSRWLGSRRLIHDRLVCAWATFSRAPRAIDQGRTLTEAFEEGWWYATPLPAGGALAALFCEPRTTRARGYARPGGWYTALESAAHVHAYVGSPQRPQALTLTAVTLHCLDVPAGRDWMALGDAAAALDPLSSAGLILALRDGLQAAEAVSQRTCGDETALATLGSAIRRRHARYLAQRAAVYGAVRRWPDARFWRDRSR